MQIYNSLKELTDNRSILIIGLGNLERGEDGVGIKIVGKLKEFAPDRVFSEEDGIEEVILNAANNNKVDTVIFVDAVDFGGKIGESRIFRANSFSHYNISTHKIPIDILSAFLMKKGKKVYLLGIQIGNTGHNLNFSNMVKESVEEIYKTFREILKKQH